MKNIDACLKHEAKETRQGLNSSGVERHNALKRFNDIVTITVVIVFLAVIAMLSMISLCVIAA